MASLSLRCSKDWNSLQERKSMRCSTTSVVLVLELSYLEFSVCKILFRILIFTRILIFLLSCYISKMFYFDFVLQVVVKNTP